MGKKEPFDFQALVRDYGWDLAEKVRADWRAANDWLKRSNRERHEVASGWRRIFRGAEGGK